MPISAAIKTDKYNFIPIPLVYVNQFPNNIKTSHSECYKSFKNRNITSNNNRINIVTFVCVLPVTSVIKFNTKQ